MHIRNIHEFKTSNAQRRRSLTFAVFSSPIRIEHRLKMMRKITIMKEKEGNGEKEEKQEEEGKWRRH